MEKAVRLIRYGGLGAALCIASCLAVRVFAGPDTDPQTALAEINKWFSEQYAQARATNDQGAFNKLMQERVQKAKAAVEGLSPATIAPQKALALAQLYNMAQMKNELIAAAERLLTSNPEPQQKFGAQSLLLSGYSQTENAVKLRETLLQIQPPAPAASASLASMAGNMYYELIADKLGAQAAMDVLDKLEAQVPFDKLQSPQEKMQADSAIVGVASGRADLLKRLGKSSEIIPTLEAAKKRLSENSRYARSLDSMIKQNRLIGSPAPELKRDRGYGQFTSLESLRGKVVLVDFFAHW